MRTFQPTHRWTSLKNRYRERNHGIVHTLGELYWSYREDQQEIRELPGVPEFRRHAVWEVTNGQLSRDYDRFWTTKIPRPDYELWQLLRRRDRGPVELNRATTHLDQWTRLATQSGAGFSPEVCWGLLTVLSVEMCKFSGVACSHEYGQKLLHINHEYADFLSSLQVLPGAERSCALVRLFWRSGEAKLRFHTAKNQDARRALWTISQADVFLKSLDGDLTLIHGNEDWANEPLSVPDKNDPRQLFPQDPYDLLRSVAQVLYRARGLARHALFDAPKWTEEIACLMDRALPFMRAAFFTIATARGMCGRNSQNTAEDVQNTRQSEMRALRRLGQAYRDAGKYLEAAGEAHRLLWMLDEELRSLEVFVDAADDLGHTVRQVGLSVPKWFERELSKRPAEEDPVPPLEEFDEELCAGWRSDCHFSESPPDPSALRRLFDQTENPETAPHWKVVLGTVSAAATACARRVHPLSAFVFGVRQKKIVPTAEQVRAAYHLCIHYRAIDFASHLLDELVEGGLVRWEDLNRFADVMGQALEHLPIGLDTEKVRTWQGIARRALARLGAELPAEGALSIHELLLGRITSILQHAEASPLVFKRFYELANEEEMQDGYRHRRVDRRRGPRIARLQEIQQCIAGLGGSNLGPPALVSLVHLGGITWSRLVLRANSVAGPLPFAPQGDLFGEAKDFTLAAPSSLWNDIDWGPGFDQLGKDLAQIADGARWLVLAIEPTLAAIPWQGLLLRERDDLVVSLVPSCSWLVEAARRRDSWSYRAKSRMRLSSRDKLIACCARLPTEERQRKELEFTRVLERLQEDEERFKKVYESAEIDFGHGVVCPLNEILPQPLPSRTGSRIKITSVEVGDRPMTVDESIDAAKRRLWFVHACWGGKVEEQFLGDLGGLPGLALSWRTNLYVGPVTQVSPKTVLRLHEALLKPEGPETVGERYLEAVRTSFREEMAWDRTALSLYTLFGLADEGLRVNRNEAGRRLLGGSV